MSSEVYPLKHRRLEQLREAGFNVVDFICFEPRTLEGQEQKLADFLARHGRISCRHFHQEEKKYFKCPVLYDQTDLEKILEFCHRNNYGENDDGTAYYTLCNQALDLSDSICAGNILTLDDRNYYIEYFYGPGTPRDIEHKGADELKLYTRSFGAPARGEEPPPELKRAAYLASKFRPVQGPYIIEFSLYPTPSGSRKLIVWEWRMGWLHYQLQANKFLLDQLKQVTAENAALEEEVENLRRLLREAHTANNQLRDDMIVNGLRQETFGV